jgi:hypothetical protein
LFVLSYWFQELDAPDCLDDPAKPTTVSTTDSLDLLLSWGAPIQFRKVSISNPNTGWPHVSRM